VCFWKQTQGAILLAEYWTSVRRKEIVKGERGTLKRTEKEKEQRNKI
jgi:hypothetical protein